MHKLTIFTVLSVFFLSAPAAPSPLDKLLNKRSYFGQATNYDPGSGGVAGACGYQNTNADSVVALSTAMYGSGGYCGQGVEIINTANGNTASGMVADVCPSCGTNDLDLSQSLFEELGNINDGVLPITWYFT